MAIRGCQHTSKPVLKNTNAFKKVGSRWVAKRYDKIPRDLDINENGRIVPIEINDSRTASRIAHYHQAVKQYLEQEIPAGFLSLRVKL